MSGDMRKSIDNIAGICKGPPLALAVSGSTPGVLEAYCKSNEKFLAELIRREYRVRKSEIGNGSELGVFGERRRREFHEGSRFMSTMSGLT